MEVEQLKDLPKWNLDAELQQGAPPKLPATPRLPEVVILDDEDSEHQSPDGDVSSRETNSSNKEDEDMDEKDMADFDLEGEDPEEFINIIGMGTSVHRNSGQ